MVDVFQIESYLLLAALLLLVGVKAYALGNALLWPATSYDVADKLTKVAWAAILGLGLLLQLLVLRFDPLSMVLHVGFVIAALVYLLDVRPAVAALSRR